MKLAVVIIANPAQGEEPLARAVNALALAAEAHGRGDQVQVVFIGTGTRWPAELSRLDHPGHALYQSVRELVAGASCACAQVFGATEGVEQAGVPVLRDNPIAGTPGFASVRRFLDEGYQTLVF